MTLAFGRNGDIWREVIFGWPRKPIRMVGRTFGVSHSCGSAIWMENWRSNFAAGPGLFWA